MLEKPTLLEVDRSIRTCNNTLFTITHSEKDCDRLTFDSNVTLHKELSLHLFIENAFKNALNVMS